MLRVEGASYRPPRPMRSRRRRAETPGRRIPAAQQRACIGTKVIASEALPAIRKDVLSKCYGGDVTRKKKLLKKQAEGKKRMKAIGRGCSPRSIHSYVETGKGGAMKEVVQSF
ncbi:unnamed protein product [Urochloa humidicola]